MRIYAEIAGGKMLAEAHYVTGMDADSDVLAHLISLTLDDLRLARWDVNYINAHGTGTLQNDVVESRDSPCWERPRTRSGSARRSRCWATWSTPPVALNWQSQHRPCEMVCAGELNLTQQDPQCNLDCIPLVGRKMRFQAALKLSVAFGGHLAAVALRRRMDASTGFAYPDGWPRSLPPCDELFACHWLCQCNASILS